jgi:DNA-binding response OmpR family regulator
VDADPEGYDAEVHDLESRRTQVEFYSSARSVLRSSKRHPPELCIVNLQLPDMSGLDLYQMLIDRWPGVPIYLVGDKYNPEDEIRARCSGATLYFCKPIESGWLSAATELVA